ncbi:conserved hypothetical protein [Methylocella tundrae]|jgi:hypothetical protein|uniref:Uncharacterized protein n=1 Tax=Methylocella tundrae TaxID=227605 RepID=A0A4U8Z2M4_METTU|nr:DUF5335 domain-containing protein [Methylocella tundrae]WPP03557.1 DUF5335 domain-containing protein [Methylocella tundrae]VFU09664.1 conserved protein of unknown function [Methylocella tundrae]VTZ27076.1 conserved hypothetical protein [Methylocella tundrae]VTZ48088.1 conserved hypothetical protein [Methylocella tundrae]
MTAKKLEKAEWGPYFDHLSKTLKGAQAEIEVASLKLGDQVEASWLPLIGLVYDPKDNIIEVALDGIDHLIAKPRDVFVDAGEEALASVEIVDGDDNRQIVRFRQPLALPPPAR